MSRFPIYQTHAVNCFHCGAPLQGLGASAGDPPGQGQFVTPKCECGYQTWYDVVPSNRAIIEAAGDVCDTIAGALIIMHVHNYLRLQGRLDD